MLEFIQNWWGLLAVLIIGVTYLIVDWQGAKGKIRALIFIAEEQAREFALETGKDKMGWVIQNGYPYMPPWFKLVISETAFQGIVQFIFDQLVQWAENKELSRAHK